jgi:1,4-alpha-glucan branching enzyme
MSQGYLAIVLHAHLPFVRHPEHERHLEERWFYEALIECYLPLVDVLDRLAHDGVPIALTMSLTPPLAAMMKDELLRKRFEGHLARMEALAEKEMVRLYGDAELAPLATFYREELARVRTVWERHDGDLIRALCKHWDAGNIELIACSATHCYLPAMLSVPEGVRGQLELGMRGFESLVGRRPLGMWLPECAYHPDIDQAMADAGVRFTILDTHGVTRARPQPPFGEHAPILSPGGVAFFARDQESSRQVWSREEGYPGDAYYRDFYRDIGFDLPEEDLHGEVVGDGNRLMTGIKYYRITGKRVNKQPYIPSVAKQRAWEHAGDFVRNRATQIEHLARSMTVTGGGVVPIVVSPYDAELFGHWWYEGPMFLEAVFRRLAEDGRAIEPITLRGYLDRHPVAASATPSASSWGAGGYGEVWVGMKSAWVWRHVHHATRYATWLVRKHAGATGARGRALDQIVRELLLLQSSDWPFILHTGTSSGYALARLQAHDHRLRRLGHMLDSKNAFAADDAKWLDDVCARDNFLDALDSETLRAPFARDTSETS